jgi:potassium channel subfamily K, other eukaryote
MVPLPIIIPVFQMITEKAPVSSPVEEPLPNQDSWHDSSTRDGEKESRDEDNEHNAARRRDGAVTIDIADVQPLEEHARDPHPTNDLEFEYPRRSPNHGRKDTRFRSFPSISTWSTRSSSSVTKHFSFRRVVQKLWAFILQNDGRHNEEDFIPNYRWLPILSGVTIPFAILLQIPGLTEHW